ncbi:Cyn operon transcriptional activator [Roseibium aggregatum]|uniref:Cyn operon transcriptional activator n=2 Tax=Roseibium aggregatum TaxID=187304 RepID=A0A0M6YDY1_9HYPH|nr:Cyn operon transcriptional activator [Roseibium aggregatum]
MSRAAETLHRTQPAISQAIKRLEDSAAVPLLERRRSGLVPTPAGQVVLEQARSIFATISRMPLAFEKAPQAISGMITIATIDQVTSPLLDKVISGFFSRHPGVDLEVNVMTTANIMSELELGSCTLGISDGVVPANLRSAELCREQFGLFCGAQHHLAGRTDLTVSDLRDEPFVGFTADVLGGEHMGEVTAYRAKASIGQKVRGQSSYVNEVRRMIECGLGIGFLPLHLAKPHVAEKRLWRLPPYTDTPTAPVHILFNPNIQLSRAEQLFLETISQRGEFFWQGPE